MIVSLMGGSQSLGVNSASKPDGNIQAYNKRPNPPPIVAMVATNHAAIQSPIRQRSDIWRGTSEFMIMPVSQIGPRYGTLSTVNFDLC